MKLNQVKALRVNLSEEDAKKIVEASQEELKKFVPKKRFDEVNNIKKQLKNDIKNKDVELANIKKSVVDNKILKHEIESLQYESKIAKEKYEADLKELQISNKIRLAITDKAKDVELVTRLFDKSKLILDEDGKIIGLDEQLKNLQESKPFLFKVKDKAQKVEINLKEWSQTFEIQMTGR